MRALIIVFAFACSEGKTKDSSPPIAPLLDQSCTADTDCQIVQTTCCSTDCDPIGQAVSTKYWARAAKDRERSCAKVTCPSVTCPMLPACRDESHAVCKQGTCTLERRPNAACAGSAAP